MEWWCQARSEPALGPKIICPDYKKVMRGTDLGTLRSKPITGGE